jgi:hypothetical protein
MTVCIQDEAVERRDGVCTVIDVDPTTLTRISGRFSALSESFESCVHGKCLGIQYTMNNLLACVGFINAVCSPSTS